MTAGNMLKPEGEESHSADNAIIRLARKLFHTTPHYDGDKLFTNSIGVIARLPSCLGAALINSFAWVFFTATAFSLLGLRQLFFLIDGLPVACRR